MPHYQSSDESLEESSVRRRMPSTRPQTRSRTAETEEATTSSMPTLNTKAHSVHGDDPVSRSVPALNSPQRDSPAHSYSLRSMNIQPTESQRSPQPSGSRQQVSPRLAEPSSPSVSDTSSTREVAPYVHLNMPLLELERDRPVENRNYGRPSSLEKWLWWYAFLLVSILVMHMLGYALYTVINNYYKEKNALIPAKHFDKTLSTPAINRTKSFLLLFPTMTTKIIEKSSSNEFQGLKKKRKHRHQKSRTSKKVD